MSFSCEAVRKVLNSYAEIQYIVVDLPPIAPIVDGDPHGSSSIIRLGRRMGVPRINLVGMPETSKWRLRLIGVVLSKTHGVVGLSRTP
jgi:hypothetical protein